MQPIIRLEHVSKKYRLHHQERPRAFRDLFLGRGWRSRPTQARELWAVRDVSLVIQPGETVGLIGPNGAGKSTTFKLISRIIAPTSGRVEVRGRVSALLELGTGFHPELSGRDNVFLSGALAGMGRAEMTRKYPAIVDFAELEEFMDVPVKRYSSGMFARLAFAVSIHLDPEILLVDEVLSVGDHAFQQKCLDRIAYLQRQGITICLVTHLLDAVRSMCTRALWFEHGRLRADGVAESVVRQYLDETTAVEALRLAQADAHSSQRWGSAAVRILRVRLTNGEGNAQTIFQTGEPLVVHMDYQTHRPATWPVFGLAIHRQDGVHVCGPNTGLSDLTLPTVEGEGTVSYSIPYLPLLDGLYQLSVSAHNTTDTEMYDYHDRLYVFRVVNRDGPVRERYGVMTVRGEWSHVTAALSEPGVHPA